MFARSEDAKAAGWFSRRHRTSKAFNQAQQERRDHFTSKRIREAKCRADTADRKLEEEGE